MGSQRNKKRNKRRSKAKSQAVTNVKRLAQKRSLVIKLGDKEINIEYDPLSAGLTAQRIGSLIESSGDETVQVRLTAEWLATSIRSWDVQYNDNRPLPLVADVIVTEIPRQIILRIGSELIADLELVAAALTPSHPKPSSNA